MNSRIQRSTATAAFLCIAMSQLVSVAPAIAQTDNEVKPVPADTVPKPANATPAFKAERDNAEEKVQVDDKITTEEKKHEEKAINKSDKMVTKQAAAINRIPGKKVAPTDLQEGSVKKKGGFTLNPIAWLMKPVTRLQEQTVRLEQQVMKLTGPIAALQPSMLGLENRMVEVQGQMKGVQGSMGAVDTRMSGVQKQLTGMQGDLSAMRNELGELKKPIQELRGPIMSLRDPLLKIEKPVTGVELRLVNLDKQLNDLKALISMVLTAIFIAAAVIAVGTPMAAILVWRNRSKLLPKPKAEEAQEEAKLATAGRSMDRQLPR